jgi:hypothetical protein
MRVHLGLVIALSVVSSCGGSAVSTATPPPARVEAPQGELSFRPIERAEWVVGCSDYAIETRVGGARPVVRQVPAPGAREEVLLRSLASLRYRRPTGRRARLLRDQRWISVAVDRVVHFRAHEGISSVAVAGTAATAHWTLPWTRGFSTGFGTSWHHYPSLLLVRGTSPGWAVLRLELDDGSEKEVPIWVVAETR